MLKRLLRKIGRVLEYPRVLLGKLKGIRQTYCFYCLAVEELLGRPAKTIIDVGANRGDFIDACKYVFPNAKIYAFEPQKRLYDILCCKKNVTAFNFGLWDKDKEFPFYYNDAGSRAASSFLKHQVRDWKEEIKETKAVAKRFDKLNINIERPCYVKIDVEGAEDRVIRGFGDYLEKVDLLQVEWLFREYYKDQMKLSKIMPLLEKYGFVGFVQRAVNINAKGIPYQCDLIFFKQRKIE